MFDDTIADWQSLTKLYGEMSDGELLELDAQLGDLTEMAQQVLRDEMRKRGLSRPRPAEKTPNAVERIATPHRDPITGAPAVADDAEGGELSHEYTWKTLLCVCEEREEAASIWEVLRQAGIQSWYEGPRSNASHDPRKPSILVAADQLEDAREIIARPIPREIIEQTKMAFLEFKPPICPKCGAEDPVLESAEPVNSWLCEECGKQWSDSPPE
jgi:hypothetical protein